MVSSPGAVFGRQFSHAAGGQDTQPGFVVLEAEPTPSPGSDDPQSGVDCGGQRSHRQTSHVS